MVPLEPSANLVSHGSNVASDRMQEEQEQQKMEKVEIVFWLFFALGLSQMLGSSSKNEADVLLEFKKGINDTQGTLLDWNPGNVANMCVWAGISCDSSTSVVSIRLTSLLLQGSISPSTQLRELNLSRNYYMSGEIPSEITNCSLLEVLDLSYNLFQGRIPGFLGRLQRLRHPSLELLQPGDSSSLANCSSLKVIDLSRNQLGDRIPESLGQLSRLQNLSLAENSYMQASSSSTSRFLGRRTLRRIPGYLLPPLLPEDLWNTASEA
ncbi:probable LRR receptor-like serine/threonine-protein kinase At4g36180 [Selaginella moellendorffii]|uniref:probable LRR receptor-like serine/threonine-protein kinase At4g36180 n=1 Tax=Selaginella moellendorffii TaxID=88036 RepID=UPI000D1CF1DF|nr:probable LRR receptor-like serine/threonine-protein kinase At4g36180 [Selaginella moellendorffii]XP_024533428.1 probable LRR receptor-like serine/threonine-protein kinase At4g36180 [Selaginella moellendorffii]|eukprot:XP_024533427.1 probable LRR receptor-like serine/threonine-protein kinase At4g36180 [Selaginella moellendorffii]